MEQSAIKIRKTSISSDIRQLGLVALNKLKTFLERYYNWLLASKGSYLFLFQGLVPK